MSANVPSTWSIRRRVLAWLFSGMALVFTANLASSYYGTREAADSAYDRLLLASASTIAERIVIREDNLHVDIPYVALDMLASTAQDRVFYSVLAPDGAVVTGYGDLPAPLPRKGQGDAPAQIFYNTIYKDTPVRVVALRSFVSGSNLSGYATVRVAQTRGERDALTFSLMRQSAFWMLVIAISGAAAAWLGISVGLRPLGRLRAALGRRSPEDVRPVLHHVPKEFKPLVGAINGMLHRLDGGLQSMGRFISDASHQLKTPLASLQAQTEMALRETDPQAIREALTKVNQSARRTSRLAQQLLSHARATNPTGSFRELDLANLARETISVILPQSIGKNIDLGYEGDERVPMFGDRTLLGELILNLLDNALRYTPPESVVTISARADGGIVRLWVVDNGPGIPAKHRTEVFERFVRIPNSTGEGCGLGLAIVREIALQHGGRVTLSDADGEGLKVEAEFPGFDLAKES